MESNLNKTNNEQSEQWAKLLDISSDTEGEPSAKRQKCREQPPWWSEELRQFRNNTIASRRQLQRARRKGNVDEVIIDLAFAAYKHDKLVFKVAIEDAKAHAERSANKESSSDDKT
ncbi:unnamed protein product [Arctia plantaginis]|uniref:Uncharacterized protein n=1 Tax=Arctia plantaginis TaxID=874455 RepID=A0A8S0ZBX1_ARCPL|nr:unnamed protein product [Arctia plantaginis]CAB3255216.1 unnamed protein product [Arctia plantaginis]